VRLRTRSHHTNRVMIVAAPAMQRRAIPAQKGGPWGLVMLLTAAARVDDDIAWLEVEVGKVVDVVVTFPEDVGEAELSGDDGRSMLSNVEEVA